MSKLIKGMYADYVTSEFDIRYNQIRTDALVTNAGWFNSKGEKLGFGDLNLNDLDNISMEIESNEVFIVLTEADCSWDMPDGLDCNAPGAAYVMKHAKWVISGLEKTESYIWNVVAPHRIFPLDSNPVLKDGIEQYYECTRVHLYSAMEFDGKKFTSIKPTPTAISYGPGYHYGLDQYDLTDGSSWAVGNWAQTQEAGLKRAADFLPGYILERALLDKFGAGLSTAEKDIIQLIAGQYSGLCLSSLKKLMPEKCIEDFCKHIFASKGVGELLAINGIEYSSNEIKGLPANMYAFKVA